MQRLRMTIVTGATMLVAATGAGAQMRASANVPPGFIPPAGMCRVWYDGVAPGRQPAPTDCGTARANLRPGSHLVYGESLRTDGRTPGGWNDGRGRGDDRDGRYGQVSEKQRRKWEKERRKDEHEREKARRKAQKHHGRGHDDGDDDDDDDDDDDRDERHGRNDGGIYRGNDGIYRGNDGIYRGGQTGSQTGRTGGVWGKVIEQQRRANGQCIDANRDGICDNTQGTGRNRIP